MVVLKRSDFKSQKDFNNAKSQILSKSSSSKPIEQTTIKKPVVQTETKINEKSGVTNWFKSLIPQQVTLPTFAAIESAFGVDLPFGFSKQQLDFRKLNFNTGLSEANAELQKRQTNAEIEKEIKQTELEAKRSLENEKRDLFNKSFFEGLGIGRSQAEEQVQQLLDQQAYLEAQNEIQQSLNEQAQKLAYSQTNNDLGISTNEPFFKLPNLNFPESNDITKTLINAGLIIGALLIVNNATKK